MGADKASQIVIVRNLQSAAKSVRYQISVMMRLVAKDISVSMANCDVIIYLRLDDSSFLLYESRGGALMSLDDGGPGARLNS